MSQFFIDEINESSAKLIADIEYVKYTPPNDRKNQDVVDHMLHEQNRLYDLIRSNQSAMNPRVHGLFMSKFNGIIMEQSVIDDIKYFVGNDHILLPDSGNYFIACLLHLSEINVLPLGDKNTQISYIDPMNESLEIIQIRIPIFDAMLMMNSDVENLLDFKGNKLILMGNSFDDEFIEIINREWNVIHTVDERSKYVITYLTRKEEVDNKRLSILDLYSSMDFSDKGKAFRSEFNLFIRFLEGGYAGVSSPSNNYTLSQYSFQFIKRQVRLINALPDFEVHGDVPNLSPSQHYF